MNLVKILKDCPERTKLYSPLFGEVAFNKVLDNKYIIIYTGSNTQDSFYYNGKYFDIDSAECLLFPSKDNRDWSTFNVPKKEHKFKPFDRVLVRNCDEGTWLCDVFSNIGNAQEFPYVTIGHGLWKQCIPYKGNEHLVGTTNNLK